MPLLRYLAAFSGRLLSRAFDRATLDSCRTQEQLLLTLVRNNRDTAFGRDHGFATVRSVADYRRQVPLQDYDSLWPYIERATHGEPNVLTSEPPFMFATTSGTTGDPKFIPVTTAFERASSAIGRLWLYRAQRDHPDLFSRKILSVVSPAVEGYTQGAIPYGSASGHIYRQMGRLVRSSYAIPYRVFGITDYDAKYYVIMRVAMEQSISFLATPNPSTIIKLVETGNDRKEDIIRDIRDGTLSGKFEVPKAVRERVSQLFPSNPRRARELERFAQDHGALRPRDYWPDLRLIGCWTGGTVGIYVKKLGQWFGPDMAIRDLGYLSTEARASLPIEDGRAPGVIAVNANFYEFIPTDEIENEHPQVLPCDELEEGREYYVVLTTPGGLYRYDINDILKVTGFYNTAPLVEFVQKGRDMTSLTGEKLHVSQVVSAIDDATGSLPVRLAGYQALADVETSRYHLMVEFEGEPPDGTVLRDFVRQVDDRLCSLNLEYEAKRKSGRLAPPCLNVMKRGWHEHARKTLIGKGIRDSQLKTRVLAYFQGARDTSEVLYTLDPLDPG